MARKSNVIDNSHFLISSFPPSNYEIWIAEDVVIPCRAKPRWWHKFFIKLFFGWKYKKSGQINEHP